MKLQIILISLSILAFLLTGCASMNDVLNSKDEGTVQVYPVDSDQAWEIAKTVFRWEGTDAIEEHKDQN